MSRRTERVAEAIRQEVGRIVVTELSDPRIGFVTVTRVEVSHDLSVAKVFVSIMENEGRRGATLHGLESAKRRIRNEIGDKLMLRKTPELIFRQDPGVKQSIRMGGILNELAREREGRSAPDLLTETSADPSADGEQPKEESTDDG